MQHAGWVLMMLVSMSVPIATLVFVILIFNKMKKIEKGLGGR